MIRRKQFIIRFFALMLVVLSLMPGVALAVAPDAGASGAVLLDLNTRRVLFAQNAHQKLPMASTTKVMTALIALERAKLGDIVTVPKEAYGTEGSSMYLNLGEKLTMEDLLYGLMLSSGNDAAITIAVHIGGSVEGFAAIMNEKAKALGALNTNFVTPNGLHDDAHYTTAYDLALICCAAMELPSFREIVNTQYWKTKSGDVQRTLKSKNKLLWQYDGGNGIKTGFTKAAGRCLTFSAEREGNGIIGVVLNCPDMWNSAKTLLDYGYSEYEWKSAVTAGDVVKNVNVVQGMTGTLEIVAKEDIFVPVKGDESMGELRVVCPDRVRAPVYAGQSVGNIELWADGRVMASTELIARSTVYEKSFASYLDNILKGWVRAV